MLGGMKRMNIRKALNRQITSPGTDAGISIAMGLACLIIAAILLFGRRPAGATIPGLIGVINIFSGWRARRKIAASKDSESKSRSERYAA
jgi:type IV secretory pathway TrbD component